MNIQKGTKGFMPVDSEERFWSKVDKSEPNGCWLWAGANDGRYGQFWMNNRKEKAHRVSWLLTHGEIPEGKMACHRCDNPSCVNPDHIFWGTMSDNILDAVSKGRHDPRGNALRTHCKRGHLLNGDNMRIRPSTGHRECIICRGLHNRARYSDSARAALAKESTS
jgi:hypothetical protein